jgi:hypothetical protein
MRAAAGGAYPTEVHWGAHANIADRGGARELRNLTPRQQQGATAPRFYGQGPAEAWSVGLPAASSRSSR